jgi:sulfonate transport system substrate-binding protein
VYVFSKPEWTALVVGPRSSIATVADLKGKKVAATKGTDPFIFLLRLLHDAGLGKGDVDIVHLQHPDGRAALERGDVDAWAGLDPHMAVSEIEHGSRLVVRNPGYNTYGFLSVRQPFLQDYPSYIPRVLKAYERARRFALANPAELASIAAEESKISLDVATRVVGQRHDFKNALPGGEHREGLARAADILVAESLVKQGVDPRSVIADLIDDRFAKQVVA